MGYTHYWENSAMTIPDAALIVIREIVGAAYHAGLIQYEHDAAKPPLVSRTLIRFNGVREYGHETFFFDVNDDYRADDGRPFAFCKTACKPYDAVVMKVLIVLKSFLKDELKVTSDGSFAEEWAAVREEMADRYGIRTYINEELTV
ncbi:MAG: hypothetical protein M3Y58_07040 [Chloroflexota bacterium]|nr:hypothetical protein [Chloroflexota bacterium]